MALSAKDTAIFRAKVPGLARRLQQDIPGLSVEDVAAIWGNAGHESYGFQIWNQIRGTAFGWFQWDGVRRKQFEAWAKARNLQVRSDEANYGFLVHELRGPEKRSVAAVKAATGLKAKTIAFEKAFERAGIKYNDRRLAWAEVALKAIQSGTVAQPDPVWLANARELVGLKEIVGSKHEPKVVKFFAEAGHPSVTNDETAWCAAFANAMLIRAGYKGTGTLLARSFLQWGQKLTTPKTGCIVVFMRGGPKSWQGHVGFYVGETTTHVRVLGGNQGNAVSIANYPKSELLGYRWPSTAPVPVAKPKIDEATKAGAAASAGAVVATGGAAVAVQQGVSALEILLWIGGLSLAAAALILIAYRIIKGTWPWSSTGDQSPGQSPPTLQRSGPSLEQLSAALLELQSAALREAQSQPRSGSKRRRKQSARRSRKTLTRQRSSPASKRSKAKGS